MTTIAASCHRSDRTIVHIPWYLRASLMLLLARCSTLKSVRTGRTCLQHGDGGTCRRKGLHQSSHRAVRRSPSVATQSMKNAGVRIDRGQGGRAAVVGSVDSGISSRLVSTSTSGSWNKRGAQRNLVMGSLMKHTEQFGRDSCVRRTVKNRNPRRRLEGSRMSDYLE